MKSQASPQTSNMLLVASTRSSPRTQSPTQTMADCMDSDSVNSNFPCSRAVGHFIA
ncbi:hypothetical protein A2U01_0005756, partial [Trifolium medium]|nr:hypothetical protein [Trifolium medium]